MTESTGQAFGATGRRVRASAWGALSALGLLGSLLLSAAGPAAAQDLNAQVQRLQQELKTLQGYVYGGQSLAGGGSAAGSGVDLNRPVAARLELRISQLENQIRTLTGQIEQVNFQINQVSRRLDGLTNDVYARLQRLEQQAVVPGVGLASPADLQQQGGEAPGQAPQQPAIASLSAGTGGQLAPGESGGQVIGSVSASNLEALRQQAEGGQQPAQPALQQQQAAAQPQSTQSAAAGTFATAKDQYDHAFALLSQANYPAAEQALGAFLVAHPDDQLAGNAKYWLGETQYVRGQYRDAAVTFAEGYQQYPNSPKAPDNLLKLAKSLAALGQTEDSCGTLGELVRRYPRAPANVLQQTQREQKRLSCPR